MPTTSNFGWTTPTPDGDTGVWDTILNTLFDDADDDLNTVKGTADAALPKAGGVMTGEIEIKTEKYDASNRGSISGTTAVGPVNINFHYGTVSGDTTFSFPSSLTSGKLLHIELELTNGGAHSVSWPAAVEWDGGAAPALQSSGVDMLVFYSRDGGTTWRGMHAYSSSS